MLKIMLLSYWYQIIKQLCFGFNVTLIDNIAEFGAQRSKVT